MALTAYVGVMGSGKTYEAVSSVILPALALGRRVVTNINGLSPDLLREFAAQQSGKPLDEIGELVRVKGAEIADADFFPEPVDGEEEDEGRSWQAGRFVNPGDLVVIDEAWEWWGAGSKIAPRHHKYFRMHRHGVDADTGIAGDVVLIVQVLSDLHRSVSSVLDFVYSMTKQKSVGLDNFYRVDVYRGYKLFKKNMQSQHDKKYDPKICALYQSYQGGKGREVATDKRQNVFASKKLWVMAALVVIGFAFSLFMTIRFFTSGSLVKSSALAAPPVAVVAVPPLPVSGPTKAPPISETWRLVGRVDFGDRAYVVLANNAGRLRYESPAAVIGNGLAGVAEIDGERVTRFSGNAAAGGGGGTAAASVPPLFSAGK